MPLNQREQSPVVRGSWTATAGRNVFRGTWSAQSLPGKPNAVQGSWTLLDEAGRVVLEGTWAADKLPRAWQGRWSARIAGRGAATGEVSGTWTRTAASPTATLADMLKETFEQEIAGSWRSGARSGNWRLKGFK